MAPSSPDGFYDEGTQVQVTAKPTGGYNFLRWTGDLRSTAATESVTIDRQKSVAASFVTSPISEIVPLNAATLTADPVDPMDTAPGEIISIFGTDLGPAQAVSGVAVGGKVTTKLAGVRVLVDDLECPLVWVSSTQINAIVPYRNSAPEYSLLSVEVNGRIAKTGALHNVDTAPGVFTATGTGDRPGCDP